MPVDLSTCSQDELDSYLSQVENQIAKYTKNRDELEKLASMYKKDPDAAAKAQGEADKIQVALNTLENDKNRLSAALQGSSQTTAPVADSGFGATEEVIIHPFI